jgi:hypothetical protein
MSTQSVFVNGQKHVFPAELSDAEIDNILSAEYGGPGTPPENPPTQPVAMEQPQQPQQPQDPSLADRFGQTYGRMTQEVSDIMADQMGTTQREQEMLGQPVSRDVGTLESGVRYGGAIASTIAGMTGDVVAEGLQEVDDLTNNLLSDTAMTVLNSGLGKAAQKLFEAGGQHWDTFKTKHPETAQTIESAAEIGLLAADAPIRRAKGAAQMLAPSDKLATGRRTGESSILRRRTYDPSKREAAVAMEASELPGWNNGRSKNYNFTVLEKEAAARRNVLDRDILKAGNPDVNLAGVNQRLADAADSIGDMDVGITLVGNSETQAKEMLKAAQRFIDESDGTAKGLLDARRRFDGWIEDNAGTAFDPDIINGRNAAQRVLRDILNEEVIAAVPDVDISGSLASQSRLLEARDSLFAQLPQEGMNPISRIIQGISSGHVGPVGAWAILSGMGAGVAKAGGESLLAGGATGSAVWATWKALSRPERRQAIAVGLQYYQQLLAENPDDAQLKREYGTLRDMVEE